MRRIIRRAAIAGAVMGATKGMTSRAVAGAAAPPAAMPPAPVEGNPATVASFSVSSHPSGADIEIDGDFVGSTPSTLQLSSGQHEITIKKKGFQPWTRKMKVTSGSMNINADLEPTH